MSRPTKAELEARKHRTTYEFKLSQGLRDNDTAFITSQQYEEHRDSTPTKHGVHLMRSRLETLWAQHFEKKGYAQAPTISVPCYFYEPAGCRKWKSYTRGRHYRIDFVLVYELDGIYAKRWEWVSIKPTIEYQEDRNNLIELVKFDSLHQRAMQVCGKPDDYRVYSIVFDPDIKDCKVTHVDRKS